MAKNVFNLSLQCTKRSPHCGVRNSASLFLLHKVQHRTEYRNYSSSFETGTRTNCKLSDQGHWHSRPRWIEWHLRWIWLGPQCTNAQNPYSQIHPSRDSVAGRRISKGTAGVQQIVRFVKRGRSSIRQLAIRNPTLKGPVAGSFIYNMQAHFKALHWRPKNHGFISDLSSPMSELESYTSQRMTIRTTGMIMMASRIPRCFAMSARYVARAFESPRLLVTRPSSSTFRSAISTSLSSSSIAPNSNPGAAKP